MAEAGTFLEAVIKRDRTLIGLALAATTVLAWAYMAREAQAMGRSGVCECMGMAMGGPDAHPWSAAQLVALFLMWSEMMLAMMLPSAAPMILMFASVSRQRRAQERPYVPTGLFAGGYVVAWIGFSAAAALAQSALHQAALLSPAMTGTSPILGGCLLIAAGAFQFTPWKNQCLTSCANPLGFLLTEWREGTAGALTMGLRHGLFCLGCCWILMLLLFVLGVMNLAWIAALTLYVLAEKLLGRKPAFVRCAGIALCIWGALVLARGR